jgi:hypothetical protein
MNKKITKVFLFLLAVSLVALLIYRLPKTPTTKNITQPATNIIPTSTKVIEEEKKEEITTSTPIKSSSTEIIIKATSTPTGIIKNSVPFTPQAPFGEWSDPRQQNGCEEASALIAVSWARGETFSLQEAKNEILAISDWEQEKYDGYQDTSARDTVKRIFNGYFKYQKVEVIEDVKILDMINELSQGNLIIVPADGRKLKNPFFNPPGPEEHMLVITGYNYQTKNDPGTRHGKDYEYSQEVLFDAIRDYPTGYHQPIIGTPKTIIVIRK